MAARFQCTSAAAAYLAAMIDGEGHVSSTRSREIQIVNTEADIIEATVEACRMLNIEASVNWRPGTDGRQSHARVRIGTMESLQRVHELVPLQSARKRLALKAQLDSYCKKTLLPVLVEELARLYGLGRSLRSLADQFQVSHHAIRRRLAQHGVRLRTQREACRATQHFGIRHATAPSADELRRLYIDEQRSSTEIGRQYGVSGATVLRWLVKAGHPRRNARETVLLFQKKWTNQCEQAHTSAAS